MERFHVAEDAAVILRSKGVFKQAKVFLRGQAVFAAHAGGFVRLYKGGGTSMPLISWEDIEMYGIDAADLNLMPDAHGKLSFLGEMKQIEGAPV